MGKIISARDFSDCNAYGLLRPVIYCCPCNAADVAVPINLPLAEKLSKCRPDRRTMRLEKFFNEILAGLPNNAIIKDFDVMFNPKYKVDVLRIMIAACKNKPFSVLWSGRFEDGKLFYAEDGCADFKAFRVEDYDVTCIV